MFATVAMFVIVMSVVVVVSVVILLRKLLVHMTSMSLCNMHGRTQTTLNDLVQFTTIQPNSTALWAIIDFDTRTLSHKQV